MDTRQLILYRDLKDQSLFDGMLALILTFWPVS